jgi:hypothetical protein
LKNIIIIFRRPKLNPYENLVHPAQ